MARRLVTTSRLLALALCGATVVLWVRSYAVSDELMSVSGPGASRCTFTRRSAVSDRGTFSIRQFGSNNGMKVVPSDRRTWSRFWRFYWREHDVPSHKDGNREFPRFGFGWTRRPFDGRHEYWEVSVPYWAIAAVFALLPLHGARSRARSKLRLRKGLCRACGYDLRATPGRCPECGVEVPP